MFLSGSCLNRRVCRESSTTVKSFFAFENFHLSLWVTIAVENETGIHFKNGELNPYKKDSF